MHSCTKSIRVASRSSPLSRAQVAEVLQALRAYHPDIAFDITWITTHGDRDRTTSLRAMEKTDFFTREIEEMQLKGEYALSIHSAKDLPEQLQEGLKVIALTRCVSPYDALVLRQELTWETLPYGARVGTSSLRRERALHALRPDLCCVDIRGSIAERLEQLSMLEGVVIAEAALIRLKLTHLTRWLLPGEGAPLQGQLALVAREEEVELRTLFAPLDSR